MTKNSKTRIADRIHAHSSTTSVGLLAADLSLSARTVRRHVDALISEGRVQVGWDGNQLESTDAERQDRATDARVAARR